ARRLDRRTRRRHLAVVDERPQAAAPDQVRRRLVHRLYRADRADRQHDRCRGGQHFRAETGDVGRGQCVSTMKAVPRPVSEPRPLSETMIDAPGVISLAMRSATSGGSEMRSSASAALASPGMVTALNFRVVPSASKPTAVNTWVPSGWPSPSIVTGADSTGAKPLRT